MAQIINAPIQTHGYTHQATIKQCKIRIVAYIYSLSSLYRAENYLQNADHSAIFLRRYYRRCFERIDTISIAYLWMNLPQQTRSMLATLLPMMF